MESIQTIKTVFMNYIKKKLKKKKRKDYLLEEALEEIRKEIYKYPPHILIEFIKLFPCEEIKYKFPIGFDNSKIIIKTVYPTGKNNSLYLLYVTCSSIENFWTRWSRFKKLGVFL